MFLKLRVTDFQKPENKLDLKKCQKKFEKNAKIGTSKIGKTVKKRPNFTQIYSKILVIFLNKADLVGFLIPQQNFYIFSLKTVKKIQKIFKIPRFFLSRKSKNPKKKFSHNLKVGFVNDTISQTQSVDSVIRFAHSS